TVVCSRTTRVVRGFVRGPRFQWGNSKERKADECVGDDRRKTRSAQRIARRRPHELQWTAGGWSEQRNCLQERHHGRPGADRAANRARYVRYSGYGYDRVGGQL